ncbi:c-type cytochrome [Mesobacterium pallidum]|uniref:c-type cytochrome n=1 Tax=Mesobacterium pallidum TaxID=2872037 RepID=UPI001EE2B384|nr:cytochrome c [Mesobacterium pallidum]
MTAISRLAAALVLSALTAATGWAQETDGVGDPMRGKKVYARPDSCVNCHGWAADGKTGISLKYPPGPSLRDTLLDTEALIEVIRCGRPGTPMPFHDQAAYRDGRCYGTVMSDYADDGSRPIRGKTMREADILNVVAYLEADVIGLGKPTFEECVDFFENPNAGACRIIK